MSSFAVRSAEVRDAEAMASIAAKNPTAPQWNAKQFAELMLPRPETTTLCRTLLVAENSGGVAGFAVASALCAVFPVEAELESLAVAPAMQERGIGRALLQAVFTWALTQTAESLRLEVRVGNERALRMYDKAGFRQTGRRTGYYSDPVEDAVVMERILVLVSDHSPAHLLA